MNTKIYLVLALILISFASCDEMNSLHQPYLDEGETIYRAKTDEVFLLSGKNRVQVFWVLSADPSIVKTIITVDDNNDTEIDVSRVNAIDTLNTIITSLTEGSHKFAVRNIDKYGNSSLPIDGFGNVFGDVYRASLEARGVSTLAYNADSSSVGINLKPSSELTRSTEIKCTNLSGEEILVELANDESKLLFKNIDITKPISSRTYYVPTKKDDNGNETSIDQFDSDWKDILPPTKLEQILESITIEPLLGGVKVAWINSDISPVNFNFKKIVAGNSVSSNITSDIENDTFIIGGMDNGEQDIEITVTNEKGYSWTKSFTVSPNPTVLLDKSSWVVVDFSSQVEGYEAVNLIDGSTETLWHTPWFETDPISTEPHFVTFDMSSEKEISSFVLFGGAATETYEILMSSDNVNWTKTGNNDKWVANKVVVPEVGTKARYIKFVVLKGKVYQGIPYTNFHEIDIYGLE